MAPEEQTLGIRARIAIKWLKLNETFEEETKQIPPPTPLSDALATSFSLVVISSGYRSNSSLY